VLTVHIIRFLMTEPVMTSETSVNLYETTRRNIPEDSHLQKSALLNILLSLLGFPHHSRHTGIVLCGKPWSFTVYQVNIILSSAIHRRQCVVKVFSLFKFCYGQLWPRRELSNWLPPFLVAHQDLHNPTSHPPKEISPVLLPAVFQISVVYCLAVLQDKTNTNSH
jgi:hypothetical protein